MLDTKINSFLGSLPPVTAVSLRPDSPSSRMTVNERDATRYALLHAYTACFAAKIQLHGVFADELPTEYPLVVEAARSIVNLIRVSEQINPRTTCFFLSVSKIIQTFVLLCLTCADPLPLHSPFG